jgi:conjugal transfer/entry exclusion protein
MSLNQMEDVLQALEGQISPVSLHVKLEGDIVSEKEGQTQSEEDVQTVQLENEDWIPRDRFNAINERMKSAEKIVKELEKAQQKLADEKAQSERTSLEEQNKFKELYEGQLAQIEELTTYRERYDGLREKAQTTNDARIGALPKNFKALVPEYSDPFKTRDWLDKNAELFAGGITTPTLDGGTRSGKQKSAPTALANNPVPLLIA